MGDSESDAAAAQRAGASRVAGGANCCCIVIFVLVCGSCIVLLFFRSCSPLVFVRCSADALTIVVGRRCCVVIPCAAHAQQLHWNERIAAITACQCAHEPSEPAARARSATTRAHTIVARTNPSGVACSRCDRGCSCIIALFAIAVPARSAAAL